MTSEKSNFSALERAEHIGIGGVTKRRLLADFAGFGEAGHGVKPATSDDSDFSFRQTYS